LALRHEAWVTSLLSDLSPEARVELLHRLTLLKRRLEAAIGKLGRIDTSANELALAGAQRRSATHRKRAARSTT